MASGKGRRRSAEWGGREDEQEGARLGGRRGRTRDDGGELTEAEERGGQEKEGAYLQLWYL